jgi:subtilisin-like proprotein convertase family protein
MQRLLLAFAVAFMATATFAQAQTADRAAPYNGAPTMRLAKPTLTPLTHDFGGGVLYDQSELVTSSGTGSGGADESALQTGLGLTTFGAGHQQDLGNFIADDFEVPAGDTWTVTDFVFYGYQTGSTPSQTTFTGYYVQIWDGDPSLPGSSVVAGDLTTNVISASDFSGIYRIRDVDPPGTANTRPIYENRATLTSSATLTSGTYWVQWGATGALASGPWMPPRTLAGETTTGNALQFQTATGVWAPFIDGGTLTGQGGTFKVIGSTTGAGGPVLSVSPGTVAFGAVNTGSSDSRTVTLTNSGTEALTIASIAYTGDASITLDQTGVDLTLDPAQATTVELTFAPTTGGPAAGTVTITSNAPNSPQAIAVTGNGVPPPPSGTFPSTDTPIAIPDADPAGISSTITIPAGTPGTITNIDVDLNITHTWVGDLILTLARGATTSTLSDQPGVPEGTFGCSGDDIILTVDDDGTDGSLGGSCVTGGTPAYPPGNYTPDTPLSVFEGSPLPGDYVLTISDNAGGDTGTLNSWALLIDDGTTAGEGTPSSLTSLSVSPNPVAGQGQVSLTVGTTQDVRVALYDALGREVMVLLDRSVAAGQQAYIGFRTQQLPAGVYVIRATGGDVSLTERVTVVR